MKETTKGSAGKQYAYKLQKQNTQTTCYDAWNTTAIQD